MRTRLLALLTALALVAAACGSDDSGDDAADTTTTTAAGTEVDATETETGTETETETDGAGGDGSTELDELVQGLEQEPVRFEGTMVLEGGPGSQLTEPIEVLISGSMDPTEQASHMSMDMSALAQAAMGEGDVELPAGLGALFEEPLEIISIGETAWLRFPLLTMATGVDAEWVEVSPEQTGDLTSGLGLGSGVNSPTALLEQLRDADAEVEDLGTEEVRGVETNHLRMLVDVSQLAEQLPPEEQEQLESDLGAMEGPLPVEVWVDDDGRLHRYRVELSQAEADPEVGSATMQFEFFDHGEDVTIEQPPADQVGQLEDPGGMMGGGATETTTEG